MDEVTMWTSDVAHHGYGVTWVKQVNPVVAFDTRQDSVLAETPDSFPYWDEPVEVLPEDPYSGRRA